MSHPDEGTIQALLDGELDAEQRSRIELHVSACAACAARLAEAREFQREADRLVEMVVVPPESVLRRGRRRQTVVRTLAWAASIVVAVAAGYWGRGTTVSPPVELQESDRPTQAVATTPPATTMAPPAVPAPAPAIGKDADAGAAAKTRRSVEPLAGASPDAGRAASGEARDAAPVPETKVADRVAAAPPAAAEREALDARANQAAANENRLADEAVTPWRVASMEEAVRVLGGQIRLIDGFTPNRIEVGPGTAVAGADPGLQVVRVVYAGGMVVLDEQRPAPAPGARKEAVASGASGAFAQRAAPAWEQRGDIRFVVTGSVSVDSLRALGARVR